MYQLNKKQTGFLVPEYRLPKKKMSDAGSNFISCGAKAFYKKIEYIASSILSYPHKSKGQVEACIIFTKWTLKKCMDTNANPHIALLQIRSTPLGQGLPSPVTLLFNHPTRGIMLKLNRPPINTNNDDDHYKTLVEIQSKAGKNYDTLRNYNLIPIGSTVVDQSEDKGPWTHGTVMGKEDNNHNDQEYKIHMTKTGQLITRNRKHVKVMPITSKQYLRDQLSKDRENRHVRGHIMIVWKLNQVQQRFNSYQDQTGHICNRHER